VQCVSGAELHGWLTHGWTSSLHFKDTGLWWKEKLRELLSGHVCKDSYKSNKNNTKSAVCEASGGGDVSNKALCCDVKLLPDVVPEHKAAAGDISPS